VSVASSKASRRAGARRPRGRGGFLLGVALTCILLPLQLAAQTREPSPTELIESLLAGRDPVGGPFQLVDHAGRQRSDADYRGKLLVIYFGYTFCPDVCPTELQSISLALDALGPAAAAVQPLFISVDPERDTPARLADFVSSFHPQFVGLTGELAAIRKTALAYKTFFARHRTASPNYPVDHTGFVYLVGKDGRYRGFLPPGSSPQDIGDALRAELGAASQ
jgi:protein SCO1/2